MALVLLPCDLPSWPAVQRHLNQIKNAFNSSQLVEGMQKLHAVCCISLDPDENDKSDPLIFAELRNFLDCESSEEERRSFFRAVLPSLVSCALSLKQHKPYDGLRYSLQQQADRTELEREFVAALVANAFFSTFPRRTMKTHPTLQDCNFSKSFTHLKSSFQRKKLREVLRYFEAIADEEPKGKIVVMRQVMSKKATLDLEDWQSCDRPLCPVIIRHNGKIEQAELGTYQICFSSSRIGGAVLEGGEQQEDLMFCVFPELYVALLFVETLEKNEALTVHGMWSKTSSKASTMDDRSGESNSHVCLIDAADFSADTQALQYGESGILRETNKAFVGFQQRQSPPVRLPPIGKSFSSTPPESLTVNATRLHEDAKDDPPSLNKMKTLLGQQGGLCSLVSKMLSGEPPTADADQAANYRRKLWENRDCDQITRLPRQILDSDACKCSIVQRGVHLPSKSGSSTPIAHLPSRPSSEKREQKSKRPPRREDSDDSVYGDCQERLDDAEEVPEPPLRAVVVSARRPLTLSKQLLSSLEMRSRNLQVPAVAAKNPLEGATGMESSFLSCISHLSDSSSSSEEKLPDDDDEEEGFASCVEEMDEDIENSHLVRSKQRPVLPLDFESRGGRRATAYTPMDRLRESGETEDRESSFEADEPELHDFVLRRSSSTGFVLDEDEDLFLGDGLEHEREWLAHFRHRSVAPSRSSMSRRDSSRYSFSSDFSSDLEEIYEHFEEKMTEGPLRENPAYSGRKSMKRTLSDSLTTFLPRSDGRAPMPRSMSLTEKMQEERTNIELAKRDALRTPAARPDEKAPPPPPPLVGTRVSVDRNLSEIEECVTLPFPAWCRRASLTPQVSVWWNYNRVYDFYLPLSGTAASGKNRRPPSRLLSGRFSELNAIAEASSGSGENPEEARSDLRTPALRRSKSATDGPRMDSGEGFREIARSQSSEDLEESNRMNADERRRSTPSRQTATISEAGEKPRLKKWQVAGNLSLLERNGGCGVGQDATAAEARRTADDRSGRPHAWLPSPESHRTGERPVDLELDVEGVKPLATGNWGCEEKGGDPQLKALIQWMAASRANVPFMIYYTGGDQRVVKLNIVCRVLLDRHWTVSHVLHAVLRHYSSKSEKPPSGCEADLLDSLLPKETDL